jgi:hypothetical protein
VVLLLSISISLSLSFTLSVCKMYNGPPKMLYIRRAYIDNAENSTSNLNFSRFSCALCRSHHRQQRLVLGIYLSNIITHVHVYLFAHTYISRANSSQRPRDIYICALHPTPNLFYQLSLYANTRLYMLDYTTTLYVYSSFSSFSFAIFVRRVRNTHPTMNKYMYYILLPGRFISKVLIACAQQRY